MNRNILLLGCVGLLAALIGVWSGSQLLADKTSVPEVYAVATVLPVPRDLPDVELIDQLAQPYGLEQIQGGWTLLFMGFTNCGHICPMTLARLRAIAAELERPIDVLFISVDPQRDTPKIIAQYLQGFDAGFLGATGAPEELEKLTASLGAPFYVEQTDEQYFVDHSGAIFVINPAGQFAAVITPPLEIEPIVSDLRRLIAAQ